MQIRELAKHLILSGVIIAAPIAWSASTTAGGSTGTSGTAGVTTGTNTSGSSGTGTSAGTSAGTSGNAGVSAGTSGSATQPVVPGTNNQQNANTGSDKTTDDELAQKVKAALVNDDALATKSISATARQGTIILNGTVSSQAERAKAAQLVSSIEGVTSVKNQIKVK